MAAVSARNMRVPSEIFKQFFKLFNRFRSAGENPPSGPIRIAALLCAGAPCNATAILCAGLPALDSSHQISKPFKFVSLAQARQYAIEAKRLVINGKDPIEERKKGQVEAQLKQARNLTFKEIAEACIAAKAPEWKNAKHAQQWHNSLETYAFPILGELPISDINTDLILRVLEPIWITKAETASRVRQRIETIWDYGKARNYVGGENPARLRGHLDKILSKTVKVKRVRHFPALPYNNIGIFLQELRQRNGYSALALEFLILTAARTSEVIDAKWSEINLEKKVWTVPASRMKVGKEHRVPLCKRAIEILSNIPSNRNLEEHVFSGWKQNKGLSNNANNSST